MGATLQQQLEITCLKSELERTKIKLKDAQESSIKAHEELFEEHEEILESLKSLPSKKRKRLIEDVYKESKKRKSDEIESNLLNESSEHDGFLDPKENIAITESGGVTDLSDGEIMKGDVHKSSNPDQSESEASQSVNDRDLDLASLTQVTTVKDQSGVNDALSMALKETFDDEALLASTPTSTKNQGIPYASWHNDTEDDLQEDLDEELGKPIYPDSNYELC